MAKLKNESRVPNRMLYSRISFLQQAATLLASRGQPTSDSADASNAHRRTDAAEDSLQRFGRRLATDMRSVSLKARIRLSPAVKHTICKFCDSVLVEGDSCTSMVENRSRDGKKPWADVLVRKCHTCGRERRFPVDQKRQKSKTQRATATENAGTSDQQNG